MPTFAAGRDSLHALTAFLNTQLGVRASEFAAYPQAPKCIASDDTTPNPNEQPNQIRGPYCVLRVERDTMRPMGLVNTVYDCTVRGEVKANELTGGKIIGAAKADSTLLRVLTEIVEGAATALDELGFGAIAIEPQTEQTRSVRGAKQENNKPFRLTFYYLRPDRA